MQALSTVPYWGLSSHVPLLCSPPSLRGPHLAHHRIPTQLELLTCLLSIRILHQPGCTFHESRDLGLTPLLHIPQRPAREQCSANICRVNEGYVHFSAPQFLLLLSWNSDSRLLGLQRQQGFIIPTSRSCKVQMHHCLHRVGAWGCYCPWDLAADVL